MPFIVQHHVIETGDRVEHRRAGRICKYKGCKQVLSIYNMDIDQLCFKHQREVANMPLIEEKEVMHRIRE